MCRNKCTAILEKNVTEVSNCLSKSNTRSTSGPSELKPEIFSSLKAVKALSNQIFQNSGNRHIFLTIYRVFMGTTEMQDLFI